MSTVAKRIVLLLTVAVVLCSSVTLALFAEERVPDGMYCGKYAGGLVEGNLTMKAGSDKFDMIMVGLGLDLQCHNETFIYDPQTHHADVPGSTDPNDCIGAILTDNDLKLDVVYDPAGDIIYLDLGFTKIVCNKCTAMKRGVAFFTRK